ncbi:hypothetical protein BGP77_02545 [Saccharospirillum sp. MSK14-1]|uniref:hypothetical protein n=1 Tax=Saccharospirillum sp. MSK14-1 TaxID=1897632 RepID=UPI000D393AF5|nr:hypothetical protein [Saccharospirillum sp. MSK14-1]PTY36210.1 hypothetical protein BGP77_02545 [Saccharospirillum sp. MSK14-1]
MSLTISYDSNFANFSYNGASGLAAYMDYFQDSYSSSGHAADLEFHNNPGNLEVGSTTYLGSFFGTDLIGSEMSNASDSVDNVSFVVDGGEVTLEDSNGDAYTEEVAMYTLFSSPSHTTAAEIESLTFGDGAYSGGSLASELFTITGLDDAITSGFLDNDSDGAYDALEQGEAHDLIYDLMGGMGGSGSTSVLEDILNANDLTYDGTSADETFDSYQGNDVMNGGGGDDTFRFYEDYGVDVVNGFTAGSGDILSFADDVFTDAADAFDNVTVYTGYSVIDDGNGNQVYVMGVTNLTAADFEVFVA